MMGLESFWLIFYCRRSAIFFRTEFISTSCSQIGKAYSVY